MLNKLENAPFKGQRTLEWAARHHSAHAHTRIIAGRGIKIDYGPKGPMIHALSSAAPMLCSFGIVSQAAGIVTLRKGALRIMGLRALHVGQTQHTIVSTDSANPDWIYAQVNKVGVQSLAVVTGAQEPDDSSASYWTFPLYTFYLSGDTPVLEHDWRYDIRAGSPIR